MRSRESQINEMIKVAHLAYNRLLQVGTGGNISIRFNDTKTVLIKSSGCSFIECCENSFVEVAYTGRVLSKNLKPSKELSTHIAIYMAIPEVRAIFHFHSPLSIGFSEHRSNLPLISYHAKNYFGEVQIIRSNESNHFLEQIKLIINNNSLVRGFIHAKHGIFSFDKTITKAFYNAELIEESLKACIVSEIMKNNNQNNFSR